jgi:hypothetical protein
MSSVVARAAVAPVLSQAAVRAEQVTQLVLGETAVVLERTGEWRRVCTHADEYDGWVHSGYLIELEDQAVEEWRSAASAWSDGAVIRTAGGQLPLPLRARVVLEDDRVRLPDGKRGRVLSGCVREMDQVMAGARAQAPERWALEYFSGSPYQWGGVTPWGVDCSGLVQTTFAARGTAVPRDSGSRVNHVAFAGEADTLVHATLACGGTLMESWGPGTRAAGLRERLVAARRLEER